jgi:hypothetical protein
MGLYNRPPLRLRLLMLRTKAQGQHDLYGGNDVCLTVRPSIDTLQLGEELGYSD